MTGDSSSSSSSVGWDPELRDESDDDYVHDNDDAVRNDHDDDRDGSDDDDDTDNNDDDPDDDGDRRGGRRRCRRRPTDANVNDAPSSSPTAATIPSFIVAGDDNYDHSSSDDDDEGGGGGGGGGGEMVMSSHATRDDDDDDDDEYDGDEYDVCQSFDRGYSRDDGHGCASPPCSSLRYDMLGAPTLLCRLCPSSYLLERTRGTGGEGHREGIANASTNAKNDDDGKKCVKVGRSHRGKINGFQIFRTEYLRDNPIPDENDRDAKSMRLAKCSATWKDMSKKGKLTYKNKAEAQNTIDFVEARKAIVEAKMAAAGAADDPPPRKYQGSSLRVFQSDYYKIWKNSNPDASLAESMITVSREAIARWKCMTNAEKSPYKDRAAMESARRVPKRKRTRREKKSAKNDMDQSRIIQNGANAVDGRARATKDRERTSDDPNDDGTDMSCDDGSVMGNVGEVVNSIEGGNGVICEDECEDITSPPRQDVGDGHDDGGYVKSEYELLRERNIARNNARLLELGLLLPTPPPSEDQNSNRSRDRARSDSRERARATTAKQWGEGARRAVPTRKSTRLAVPPSDHSVSGSAANISSGSDGDNHITIRRGKSSGIVDEVDANQERGTIFGSAENASSRSDTENRSGVYGPTKYGNCIIGFLCQCHFCSSGSPASFIVHPTGDALSSLAISRLSLPRCPQRRCGQRKQVVVGVGGRILQISICGSATRSMDTSDRFCIVVRTSQYCSVIHAKSTITALDAENRRCSIEYNLQEETRIDMRSSPCTPINPSYLPVHLSCDSKATDSSFTFPTFAILSRDSTGNSTTIHRVVLRHRPVVKCHSISSSLSDISLIEFCSGNRMELWAAARSRSMPKLSAGLRKGGTCIPMTGYGHSLFRIDLRDDSSSLVWSPSHAEFLTEGLHSINGIKSDATTEHLLWVSSSSACKLWALDVRHKLAKIVVSWSLPLLSDDFGSQSALTGIYGGGVLMSQPIALPLSKNRNSSIQIHPPPMFSLKKDTNSNALCIYQFPCANPRLGTRSLESVGFQYIPKSHYEVSSIARSSIFPLPDVGGSIFNVGLVALHNSSKTCLSANQLSQLCSQTSPMNVIYVITMTNGGDLYSHSLLEFNGAEGTQAIQHHGLPVGSKVIPVPLDLEAKPLETGHLTVSLSNEFPIPSSAISPYIIREASDCCTFKTYDVGDILSRKPNTNSSLQELGRLDSWAARDTIPDQTASTNDSPCDEEPEPQEINTIHIPFTEISSSAEPSLSELIDVVDRLFYEADKDTVTVKDIIKSVANHFDLPKVEKSLKKRIKSRLTVLIQKIEPEPGENDMSVPGQSQFEVTGADKGYGCDVEVVRCGEREKITQLALNDCFDKDGGKQHVSVDEVTRMLRPLLDPHPPYVDSKIATNEPTFNYISTDSLRLTSPGFHKSEETGVSVRYSIRHSPSKFGVLSSSELSNPSSQVAQRHSQRISKPFSQTAAVTYKDQDATEYDTGCTKIISAPDKRKKSDIDVGLFTALKSSYYFFDEKANQNHQISVKNEWESDNE